ELEISGPGEAKELTAGFRAPAPPTRVIASSGWTNGTQRTTSASRPEEFFAVVPGQVDSLAAPASGQEFTQRPRQKAYSNSTSASGSGDGEKRRPWEPLPLPVTPERFPVPAKEVQQEVRAPPPPPPVEQEQIALSAELAGQHQAVATKIMSLEVDFGSEQVLAVSRPRLQEAAMHAARQSDE
ncbi:unnamed protein product, partial [Symbiodinium sp. CCMP2456]